MTGHLSRRQLEDVVADDPRNPVAPQLRVHIAGCDRCNVRRLALETASRQYFAAHPADDFARTVVERAGAAVATEPPRRRKLQAFAPVLGAIAIAAAALLWFRPQLDPAAIRSKGSVSLEVIAKHSGAQRRLQDGELLAAGDQLAFTYSVDRPKHLLLLGVDDAGEVTRYFPFDGKREAALAPASRGQLPVGIELDARTGSERLYALFSDRPLDERAARDALVNALTAERTRGGGISTMREITVSQHTAQRTIWFRKP